MVESRLMDIAEAA